MRLSLRLALVFSLFGLAIAAGFQYGHLRAIRREAYARARTMAEVTASAVCAVTEHQARSGDLGPLGRALQEMVRQAGIATIVVKDRRGRRLVGRTDDARLLGRKPHPGIPIDQVADGIYDLEKPVDLGARGRGAVQIGFRTYALEESLHETGSRAVRLGVMAFLGITLSAWLIGTWFGLRIERVVPRLEALARDPEGFRPVRMAEAGELSRLVAAFNRLGASLKGETLRRRELEREKQDLSAMLVHDLKTPLTVIRSGIALLQEQLAPVGDGRKAPQAQRRTFELLEMSTGRLHRMVEDVLQLARLEEVSVLREQVSVDLASMLKACSKDFELVVAERRQRLHLKLPKEEAPRVLGDPTLLRRVLDNLVHNAVEHTPAGGGITLALAAGGGGVRVSVSDSGPGIPPEARSEIFRKFFQKDLKPHVGNVGLGLAFCEKAVQRHEGAIGVEDAKPHGACFYFFLPAAQPQLL